MINLKEYIKAKKIENKKEKLKKKKDYKKIICELEVIVYEAIMHDKTYFDLYFTSQSHLINLTDKLHFDKQMLEPWEFRIKMNLLSLWKLKREIRKVKKWKIQ